MSHYENLPTSMNKCLYTKFERIPLNSYARDGRMHRRMDRQTHTRTDRGCLNVHLQFSDNSKASLYTCSTK